MITKEIQAALNKHLSEEVYSSYLYYAMSAYFESQDLPGMASWMRVQAPEELLHMQEFFTYRNDRDGRVSPAAGAAPQAGGA